jgi:hypothetical protein
MKGIIVLRSKKFDVRISPTIAVGSLSNSTWYSLRMRHRQCKLGWSRSVMTGTLLQKSKEFFVSISIRIAVW